MKFKKARNAAVLALLCLLAAVVCFPIFFVLTGSMMGEGELRNHLAPAVSQGAGWVSWRLLPAYPTLRAYVELLIDSPEFYVLFGIP